MGYCPRIVVPLVLSVVLVASIAHAEVELHPEATLASVAHSNGLRGGNLAEKLGLERGVDKFTPLVEMDVTGEQVVEALVALGLSAELAAETVRLEPHQQVYPPSMTRSWPVV